MTYVLLIAAMLGGGLQHRGIITGFTDGQQCEAARIITDTMWIRSGAQSVASVCLAADEA